MLISVHERRSRLRWVERPIKVLEKMPVRKQRPDYLKITLALAYLGVLGAIMALLVRGGR